MAQAAARASRSVRLVRSVRIARTTIADDPVLAALRDAPEDDRPETDEERAAVEAAKAAFLASGQARSHTDVVAAIEHRLTSG